MEGTRPDSEQRIDLIKFYNTIFVQVVQDSALKYSLNNSVSNLNVIHIKYLTYIVVKQNLQFLY